MSFLFGKKKEGKNAIPQRAPDVQNAPGSGTSVPTLNGVRSKDRGPGVTSPPPAGSVNNSVNSVEEKALTPSPEHGHNQRGRLEQDMQVSLRDPQGSGILLGAAQVMRKMSLELGQGKKGC